VTAGSAGAPEGVAPDAGADGVPVRRPTPVVDELTRDFWDMAANGVLGVQTCAECGSAQHPPSPECCSCGSAVLSFRPASGRARLVTWTVVEQGFVDAWSPHLPFTVFLVELDDHPGIILPSDDIYFLRRRGRRLPLRVGLPMSVRFEPLSGPPYALPQFVPDELGP
jgi:uncharacterized OB-fold protein